MRNVKTDQTIRDHFARPLVFILVWDSSNYDSMEIFRLRRQMYKNIAGKWGFSSVLNHSVDLNKFTHTECMYFVFEDEIDAMQFKLSLPDARRVHIWPEKISMQVYSPIISSLNEVPTK